MPTKAGRQAATLILVLAATCFGLVLAGSAQLAPPAGSSGRNVTTSAVVAPPTVAGAGLPSFADLAEAVSPAVVSVRATTIERRSQSRGLDPFDFFFGPRQRPQPQNPQNPRDPRDPRGQQDEQRSDSSGSGFVISADGLVVTNHHVIEGATGLVVVLGGREYPAEVKGDDPATDIALLKIDAGRELTYLALGDSDAIRSGDWIMVIGSPLQLEGSVSVGVVSAKGRSINVTPDRSLENFIQTDAAINFGNSGGPLVDLAGHVVGIATAINYGAENIGFAVPVNTLKSILPQLRDSGSVRRGYLGVNITDLSFEMAESFGLESTEGTLVSEVIEGGPADKAGLRHGDLILGVDGRKIANNHELIDYVSSRQPDTEVELDVLRGNERMRKVVKLGQRPLQDGALPEVREQEEGSIEWLGIQYRDLDDQFRQARGVPADVRGIVVTSVSATSPLYEDNVQQGDVITEINGKPVKDAADFTAQIEQAPSRSVLRFYLRRFTQQGSSSAFVVVRVP